MRKLLVDSGSSKAHWTLTQGLRMLRTKELKGINPLLHTDESLLEALQEAGSYFPEPDEVWMYAAGCANLQEQERLISTMTKVWPKAKLQANSDLLAACRAAAGHNQGLVAILGTGANTCYYAHGVVKDQVRPLGYLLGDEGSGATIGRRWLELAMKGQLPKELDQQFFHAFPLTVDQVLDRVYRHGQANQFLASFMPFLQSQLSHPFVRGFISEQFHQWIRLSLNPLQGHSRQLYMVGSVAHHFIHFLEPLLEREEYTVQTVLSAPIEGLVHFHA